MEKVKVTSKKYASEIIWGIILYSMLFGILGSILSAVVLNNMSETVSKIIEIVFAVVIVILSWVCAVKSTIKKKTTSKTGIKSIMKRIWIFAIIMVILSLVLGIGSILNTKSKFDEELEKAKEEIKSYNNWVSDLYGTAGNQLAQEYDNELNEQEKAFYEEQLPRLYIAETIAIGVNCIIYVVMIRYTKHKLEQNLTEEYENVEVDTKKSKGVLKTFLLALGISVVIIGGIVFVVYYRIDKLRAESDAMAEQYLQEQREEEINNVINQRSEVYGNKIITELSHGIDKDDTIESTPDIEEKCNEAWEKYKDSKMDKLKEELKADLEQDIGMNYTEEELTNIIQKVLENAFNDSKDQALKLFHSKKLALEYNIIQKVEEQKENEKTKTGKIVEDAYYKYDPKAGKDACGDNPGYLYLKVRIPKINIDTENVNKVNKEIVKKFKVTSNTDTNKGGRDIDIDYTYKEVEDKDLLFILITEKWIAHCASGGSDNASYIYDIKNDKFLNLDGLLKLYGISKSEMNSKIKKALKKAMNEEFGISESDEGFDNEYSQYWNGIEEAIKDNELKVINITKNKITLKCPMGMPGFTVDL